MRATCSPTVQALAHHARQLLAFAVAGGDQGVQGFVQGGQGFRVQGVGVHFTGGEHAGEAQDFQRVHLAGVAHQVVDAAGRLGEVLDQGFVEFQFRFAFFGLVAQGYVHLAAAQPLATAFAHVVLQGAQALGQARAHFQVAVVHRADFPGQAGAGEVAVGSGEGGHATNHGRPWGGG